MLGALIQCSGGRQGRSKANAGLLRIDSSPVARNWSAASAVVAGAAVALSGQAALKTFVPLREGYAIKPEGTPSEPSGTASSMDIKTKGEDTLGVKRKLAPVTRRDARGGLKLAVAAIKSRSGTEAVSALKEDFYAKASRAPRASVASTVHRILVGGGFQATPLTMESLTALAAALKAGGYRGAKNYLFRAKQDHIRQGHPWGSDLDDLLKQCVRSAMRGVGPGKPADTFNISEVATRRPVGEEAFKPVCRGGIIAPFDAVIVATSWLMRGLEAATFLGEQVSFADDEKCATIELGPTKMNPAGRDCPRALACSCDLMDCASTCPVCSLKRVLAARSALGLSDKHCVICDEHGQAVTARIMIQSLRRVTGVATVTEHSMRRAGAQHYASRGVALFVIQFLGRWGSSTVERYVANAFVKIAALASRGKDNYRASGLERLNELLECSGARAENGSVTHASEDGCVPSFGVKLFEKWWVDMHKDASDRVKKWHEDWLCSQKAAVGGVRRIGGAGKVHRVVIGDVMFDTALWSTKCGWAFGAVPHERMALSCVNCTKCLAAM